MLFCKCFIEKLTGREDEKGRHVSMTQQELIESITDIHTHYGPFGEYEFSPEEVMQKMKNIGIKAMPSCQNQSKMTIIFLTITW